MKIENSFESLTNIEEKTAFSIESLRFVENLISSMPEKDNEISRLVSENEALKNTIEKARRLYSEAKLESSKAETRTKRNLYKKLQILRDRIYIIGEIASNVGERLVSEDQTITVEETNNIISSLEIIIDLLIENSLWDENDVLPPLKLFSLQEPQENKSITVKDSSHVQQSLFDDMEPYADGQTSADTTTGPVPNSNEE